MDTNRCSAYDTSHTLALRITFSGQR